MFCSNRLLPALVPTACYSDSLDNSEIRRYAGSGYSEYFSLFFFFSFYYSLTISSTDDMRLESINNVVEDLESLTNSEYSNLLGKFFCIRLLGTCLSFGATDIKYFYRVRQRKPTIFAQIHKNIQIAVVGKYLSKVHGL